MHRAFSNDELFRRSFCASAGIRCHPRQSAVGGFGLPQVPVNFWTRYIVGVNGNLGKQRKNDLKPQKPGKPVPTSLNLLQIEHKRYESIAQGIATASSLWRGGANDKGKGKSFGSGDPDLYKIFAWRYCACFSPRQSRRTRRG